MKTKIIHITTEVYESVLQLPKNIQELFNKAHQAREQAYAPYSRFKVGAAILLDSGEIVVGNNQENAAYPSGLCAERVAAYTAAANFPNQKITALAVVVGSHEEYLQKPAAPCGSCRQSLYEFEEKQKEPFSIFFPGEASTIIKVNSVADLMPFAFGPDSL